MRIKSLYLVFIFFSFISLHSQPHQIPFFSETNVIPADSGFVINYSFRIPYNSLVFEKNSDVYEAAYQINVEVFNEDSIFITRQIKQKKISTDHFDKSVDNFTFDQDVISLFIHQRKFKLRAVLTDVNSRREFPLKTPQAESSAKEENIFINPIIINTTKTECGSEEVYQLSNYNGFIPFNKESYSFLVLVNDTSIQQINYLILNNRDTVLNSSSREFILSSLKLLGCDNKIILQNTAGGKNKVFIIKDISSKLFEGDVVIKINYDPDGQKPIDFIYKSLWIDRPASLSDPEDAISYLKIIESEDSVKILLTNDEKNYQKVLNDYWKKLDPTPNTSYNEVMAEYYSRVDYAVSSFSPISGKSGMNTDRGKVFIKFGRPQKIERVSNDAGNIIEKWKYEKPDKIYSFIDRIGTGDFQLLNEE